MPHQQTDPASPHRIHRRPVPFLVVLALTFSFVACDQGTKKSARETLSIEVPGSVHRVANDGVVVVDGALKWHYAENDAAAFSLFRSAPASVRRIGFSVLAAGFAMFFLIRVYRRRRDVSWAEVFATTLVVGGALGNAIDRVRVGYVTDFIVVHAGFLDRSWPAWPTFNVADSGIVVGALCLVVLSFFEVPQRPVRSGTAQPADGPQEAINP